MAILAMQSAASGLRALNTRLDVTANNLANVNTEGFKASRVNFEDLLYIERAQPGVENGNGDQRPTGLYVGLGVRTSGTQQDFTQGSPIPGNGPLDMYIDGRGFFQVQVEDDLGIGGVAYTRAGNFVLNADNEVVLANSDGRRLEPTITISTDAESITVSSNGEIYENIPGQAPSLAGQVELAIFVNPEGLTQAGANLWVESAASGSPITGDPGSENFGQINGGMLEGSNVDPAIELIELIRTQRAFEMNSQSIQAADETLRSIAQLRR
ncbi:MAG: flagellar basal-body rod protein FlgG [Phycisphaerales bacterium]|jgi:flagellar basal-body rod protein FlgG|nr:flagellar basal-body rod protein FlgG [Phycisphaerales bacterium]